jgi:hypothetical protein
MKAKSLFGILMVAVYLGMGSMLAFSNMFGIGKPWSVIIGALMILYGIFRGIRLYRGV